MLSISHINKKLSWTPKPFKPHPLFCWQIFTLQSQSIDWDKTLESDKTLKSSLSNHYIEKVNAGILNKCRVTWILGRIWQSSPLTPSRGQWKKKNILPLASGTPCLRFLSAFLVTVCKLLWKSVLLTQYGIFFLKFTISPSFMISLTDFILPHAHKWH